MAKDKKETNTSPVSRSTVEGKDKVQGTEAELIGDRASGTDQTGAVAPDQIDQARINAEKIADPSLRDPRWPDHGSSMKTLPAEGAEAERAEEFNKEYFDSKEKAIADDKSPTMGASTDSQVSHDK